MMTNLYIKKNRRPKGWRRITKRAWLAAGGFKNKNLERRWVSGAYRFYAVNQ